LTTTAPDRGLRLRFSATATVSLPSPCPDDGLTVIQATVLEADQTHSRVAATVPVTRVPDGGTVEGMPATDMSQRETSGPTRLVAAVEPPQPEAASVSTTAMSDGRCRPKRMRRSRMQY
jgi:hypothetical protein